MIFKKQQQMKNLREFIKTKCNHISEEIALQQNWGSTIISMCASIENTFIELTSLNGIYTILFAIYNSRGIEDFFYYEIKDFHLVGYYSNISKGFIRSVIYADDYLFIQTNAKTETFEFVDKDESKKMIASWGEEIEWF